MVNFDRYKLRKEAYIRSVKYLERCLELPYNEIIVKSPAHSREWMNPDSGEQKE